MQYFQPHVDQIDLAGQQLHTTSATFARFALLLIDNTVELMCHQQAEYLVMRDKDRAHWATRHYSLKDEQNALGQHFNEKIKFIFRNGKITDTQRDFILRAHQFRNECYHVGLIHKDIIWDLAWHYHDLACGLVAQLRPGWSWTIQPHGSLSSAILKHLKTAGLNDQSDWFRIPEHLPSIIESLKSSKPPARRTLSEALSRSSIQQLDLLVDRLQFIADDGLETGNLNDALKAVLFRRQPEIDHLQDGLDIQSADGFKQWAERFEEAEASFQSPVTMRDIDRWKNRAELLNQCKTPTEALVKYTDLFREFRILTYTIAEAATQLDRSIQLEIDIHRGK